MAGAAGVGGGWRKSELAHAAAYTLADFLDLFQVLEALEGEDVAIALVQIVPDGFEQALHLVEILEVVLVVLLAHLLGDEAPVREALWFVGRIDRRPWFLGKQEGAEEGAK